MRRQELVPRELERLVRFSAVALSMWWPNCRMCGCIEVRSRSPSHQKCALLSSRLPGKRRTWGCPGVAFTVDDGRRNGRQARNNASPPIAVTRMMTPQLQPRGHRLLSPR